ncbi:MAG: PAS domain S-box protein [bacterium]|nr:PAS domain S-box protein [bacterium]
MNRLHLASAVESAGEAIVVTDCEARIRYVNPAFQSLTGYRVEEAIGQNPRILQSGAYDTDFYSDMWQTIKSGSKWSGEVKNRRKDGSVYECSLTIAPVFDGDGLIDGFVAIQRDITEIRQAERVLIEKQRELNESQREQLEMKDRFLSQVSHELRTPLAAVHQFLSLLLDDLAGPINSQQREFLGIAYRNVKQLEHLIADLTEVARAQSGKLRIEPRPLDLERAVADAVVSFDGKARAKEIRLRRKVESNLPEVMADAARLQQILSNLIENSIKFTDEEGVIRVVAGLDPDDDSKIRVTVSDTGCGIEPDAMERIFDRLHQENVEGWESRTGLGLGLYITRELVTRQGGRIWVESKQGEGTSFHFTLPSFDLPRILRPALIDRGELRPSWGIVRVDVSPMDPHSSRGASPDMSRDIYHDMCTTVHSDVDVVLRHRFCHGAYATLYAIIGSGPEGTAAAASRICSVMRRDPGALNGTIKFLVRWNADVTRPEEQKLGVDAALAVVATRIEALLEDEEWWEELNHGGSQDTHR